MSSPDAGTHLLTCWLSVLQEDGLKPDEIDMTDSSPENLKKLEKAGTDLLEKTVSALNLDTGWYVEPTDMTCKYKDAIAE